MIPLLTLALMLNACDFKDELQFALVNEDTSAQLKAFYPPDPQHLPYFLLPNFDPIWANSPGFDLKAVLSIPPFQLQDQEGNTVDEKAVLGKVIVANFFFTGCSGYCPTIMNRLKVLRKTLPVDQVLLLSHSVTPQIDTSKRLKYYAQKMGVIYPDWRLLTGPKDHLYHLARTAYYADTLADEQQTSNDFLHAEHVYILDWNLRMRGIYNGNNPIAMERLSSDVQLLLTEKARL